MALRDYQQAAVDSLFSYFDKKRGNPLIQMPTGTGKSWVIAGFLRQAYAMFPNTRVMMLTHVQELIEQNHEKLLLTWPTAPSGIYSAGLSRRETDQRITFASIASVAKRAHEFPALDLAIIDEAHLISNRSQSQYRTFLSEMQERNPKLKCIGLSATCYRMGMGMLTENGLFTDVCFDLTTQDSYRWLIDQGWLCPLRALRTDYRFNVEQLHVRGGEYIAKEMQELLGDKDVTARALAETVSIGQNRSKWLLFATGIEHADYIEEHLHLEYGIEAVAIHSKQSREERDARYQAFQRGDVQCAVSMNALTTGVDVPDIDLIGMYRPTKSTSLWVQMLGRGTRPCPEAGKKDCLVLDFTRNTQELGPINDPVLPTKPRKGKKRGPSMGAPVKACPQCKSYIQARLGTCPYCAHYFASPLHINEHSSGLEVLRLGDPVVEELDVQQVTYHTHRRRGRPDVLLVNYHCPGTGGGNIPRRFKDYVCLEHDGKGRRYAERWWSERCPHIEPPESVQRAVDLSNQLRAPRLIRVWVNKARPEILDYVF